MGEQPVQQEEPKKELAPAQFKMDGAGFNPSAGSFVPKGKVIMKDVSDKNEFPDLDFDDAPKKMSKKKSGKKKGKMVVT